MSFSDVSGASKYFVTPNEGFSTTTSGATASGATTVGLNSVSGLTNGTTFVGVIEPAGTKEQIFTGVVDTSGSQITGVVWTKGSNIDHATGVSVVDYDTGTALKLMTTGLLKEHTQAGTHGAVTATSVTASGALTGTSLVNAVHTHASTAQGGPISNVLMSNPYKFSVYRNAAAAVGNGALLVIGFDTKEFDTGSNVDVVTNKGRFTAPIAGFYLLSYSIMINTGSTVDFFGGIFKNGAEFKRLSRSHSTAAELSLGGTTLVSAAANDYFEVAIQGDGSNLEVGSSKFNTFSGHLVSAT